MTEQIKIDFEKTIKTSTFSEKAEVLIIFWKSVLIFSVI